MQRNVSQRMFSVDAIKKKAFDRQRILRDKLEPKVDIILCNKDFEKYDLVWISRHLTVRKLESPWVEPCVIQNVENSGVAMVELPFEKNGVGIYG